MWERFTYYGMRAVLVLFLVAAVASGGFGIDDKTAAAIYGLYTAGIYLAALPGRLDRRPADRRAARRAGRRPRHYARQYAAGALHQPARLLSRPGRDRARRRAAETQRQRHGRGSIPRRRRAARRRIHRVLHGNQLGRDARALRHGCGAGATSARAPASPRPRSSWRLGVLQYYLTQRHLGDAGASMRRRRPAPSKRTRRKPWRQLWIGAGGSALALGGVQLRLDRRESARAWRRPPLL